jgi:hypothetical protein
MAGRGGFQPDSEPDPAESSVYLVDRFREEELNTSHQIGNKRVAAEPAALALIITLCAFVIGLAGCAMGALAMAPMAINAVGAVGNVTMNAASNSKGTNYLHPDEDEVDRDERCDDLEASTPVVIELRRTDERAAPQWRELQVNDTTGDPHWTPAIATDGAAWHPAVNLLSMNFTPPLRLPSSANTSTYLGYAPSEPQSDAEQSELTGLIANFGAAVGTFQWNGRAYQYSTSRKLPCFPLAVAMQ